MASITGLALWQLQSVELLSVQSDSMAPLIHKGDAVLVRKPATTAIKAGDIVSYLSPVTATEIITHRVVYVDPSGSSVVTKGDANTSSDTAVGLSMVVGSVRAVVPKAGVLIDMLHSWHGLTALVYVPAAIVLAQEFWLLARHYTRPTYRLFSLSN